MEEFSKMQNDAINVKIAVIGKGVVGKSSLTFRFIKNEVPNAHEPTIEDRYKTTSTIDKKLYNIEILDTAGEDDYQNMMDMWINFGEGFLLVFAINDKESFELIKSKRDRILKGKHGEDTPMLLVGNKFDLASERQVSTEEAKSLADKWKIEYIETSAKTNHNVKDAFNNLALKINELKSKKGGCCCSIF